MRTAIWETREPLGRNMGEGFSFSLTHLYVTVGFSYDHHLCFKDYVWDTEKMSTQVKEMMLRSTLFLGKM